MSTFVFIFTSTYSYIYDCIHIYIPHPSLYHRVSPCLDRRLDPCPFQTRELTFQVDLDPLFLGHQRGVIVCWP